MQKIFFILFSCSSCELHSCEKRHLLFYFVNFVRIVSIIFISDPKNIKIYRWSNGEGDYRKIPHFETPLKDKVEVAQNATFHVNLETQTVSLRDVKELHDFGSTLIYIVSD